MIIKAVLFRTSDALTGHLLLLIRAQCLYVTLQSDTGRRHLTQTAAGGAKGAMKNPLKFSTDVSHSRTILGLGGGRRPPPALPLPVQLLQ